MTGPDRKLRTVLSACLALLSAAMLSLAMPAWSQGASTFPPLPMPALPLPAADPRVGADRTFVASLPAPTPGEGRFIVRFTRPPVHTAEALVRGMGGRVLRIYRIIPAMAVQMPTRAAEALAQDPAVAYVAPDQPIAVPRPVGGAQVVHPTAQSIPWGINRIRAPEVHTANTGAGVKVAIIDSGIDYTHPDLAANYKGGWNFVGNNSNPMDGDGHGTHCAGTVAARDNDIGVLGVAPDAWLYALKVLDDDGKGTMLDLLAAIEWCADNGMLVASMSLSGGSFSLPYQDACDQAFAAGTLLVAASGNDGGPVAFPAAFGSVIAVGAVTESAGRASFSNYGPELDLAAPGVNVSSTIPGSSYRSMNGTSMACPHVSGVAALVIARGSVTGPTAVRARLLSTAEDLGASGRDDYFGHGLVRADQAAGPDSTLPYPTVTAVNPASGQNVGPVTVAVTGTDFRSGALVKLTRAGRSDINGTGVSVVSSTRITCTLNLAGAAVGAWNVVVVNSDGKSGILPNGFVVGVPPGTYDEDFETGDLSAWPWRTGGNASWSVTTTDRRSGTHSARAGAIAHNQSTYLEVTLNCQAGNISFFKRVSSETNYDWLMFKIDGVQQDRWSGDAAWNTTPHSYPVSAGTHTFRWEYTKDYSVSDGDDTAWLDDINFPPAAAPAVITVTGIEPASGVNTGSVNVTITGTDFRAGAVARLMRSGFSTIYGAGLTVVSSTRITCTFNLTGAAAGDWNVVVTNPGGQAAELTGGFTVTAAAVGVDEDFETGDLAKWPWRTGGDGDWSIATGDRRSGSYSARAGAVGHDQSTYLEVTLNCRAGSISFFKRVSSETNYDWLVFKIDGVQQARWSGDGTWNTTAHSYPVAAGTHTFRWEYSKDYSVSSYQDTAWIDDISFPPLEASPGPQVTAITPSSGAAETSVSVTITGAEFRTGCTAALVRSGHSDINGSGVTVLSPTGITCRFDLRGAAPGAWTVRVTDPEGRHGHLTDGFTVAAAAVAADEDFETGNLARWPWVTGGHADWIVTESDKRSGAYSARAGALGDDQSSYLEVALDCRAGHISFFKRVSSETNYDWLIFMIDGVQQERWSGDGMWNTTPHSYPVAAGKRTFRWEYSKDYSVSSRRDTAWLDDISFPPLQAGPTTTFPAGLHMISLPVMPQEPDPRQVGFAGNGWARWDPARADYAIHPDPYTRLEPPASVPGRGYWARFAADTTVTIAGTTPPTGAEYVIEVEPGAAGGWVQIGNPRLADVPWRIVGPGALRVRRGTQDKTLAEAQAAGWCEDFAWGWPVGGPYELVYDPAVVALAPRDRLVPWQGYWFRANAPLQLVIPPVSAALTTPSPTRPAEGDWSVALHATASNGARGQVAIGQAADPRQMQVPPPPREGVHIASVDDDRALGVDLRHHEAEPAWDIEVAGLAPDMRIELTWPDLGTVPRTYRPVLTDLATGKRLYMRTCRSYALNCGSQEGIKRLRVSMADDEGGLLSLSGVIARAAPRGNTEVRVRLSARASLDVEVLNMAGRRVATVCRQQVHDAGEARLLWNGIGERGTRLPHGRYLLRVTARTADGQQAGAVTPLQLTR